MKIVNFFKTFKNDESGAVTVDWVVLTAAIVGLGIAVLMSVSGSTTDLAAAPKNNRRRPHDRMTLKGPHPEWMRPFSLLSAATLLRPQGRGC